MPYVIKIANAPDDVFNGAYVNTYDWWVSTPIAPRAYKRLQLVRDTRGAKQFPDLMDARDWWRTTVEQSRETDDPLTAYIPEYEQV